ncbi:hypothetical protein ACFL6I_26355, partial [candidate division KSB1 bacterium]
KILFEIFGLKLRKKLFFSVLLGILIMVIGFSKVQSLHKINMNISVTILIITFILCLKFLFFAIIRVRKRRFYFIKQFAELFVSFMIFFWIITIRSVYSLTDLVFISMIVTSAVLLIYDVF